MSARSPLYAAPILLLGLTALGLAAAGTNVLPGDVRVARAIQSAPIPWRHAVADFGNLIGTAAVGLPVGLLVVLLLTQRGAYSDAAFVAASTLLRLLNTSIKAVFDSPRPSPEHVRVTEQAHGLGFPSGHAMGTCLLAGAVIWVAYHRTAGRLRTLIIATCLTLIVVTGYGRIYTGAHWPTDVAGGYLFALSMLVLLALVRSKLDVPLAPLRVRGRVLPRARRNVYNAAARNRSEDQGPTT